MSMVINREGDPVHLPKRRDVFEWDKEVATIFDNMAMRSIPMYYETHRLHCSLLKEHALVNYNFRGEDDDKPITVADVGSSTGAFFKTLCHVYDRDVRGGVDNIRAVGVDSSDHMLAELRRGMPWVSTVLQDVTRGLDFLKTHKFDYVNVSYLLQFISYGRLDVLKSIAKRMNRGGLIFLSQKEQIEHTPVNDMFQREYIRFRMENGYSAEEIQAKTEALRNTMWVDTFDFTKELLEHSGFAHVQPTTRWLNFSSMMAVKL